LEIRPAGTPPADVTPPATKTGPPDDKPSPSAADGLTMSVVGSGNPVSVNKELTYHIQVVNNGAASQRQVSLTTTVPEGMVFNPIGTQGPDSTDFVIEGRTIRFKPITELRPGQSLTYRVRVRAKQLGRKFLFHAELSTSTTSQPLVKEESTEVI
jgi:uncharacterized repeat protein (TIGR01451 family)